MKKTEKQFFVQNLTEELKAANSTILVNFAGLNVKLQQELKKRLSEAGAKMLVSKNTLLKLAGKEAKLPQEVLDDKVLAGQTAVVICQKDPVSPIQILGKFIDEFELPQIKAGIVEGSFLAKDELIKLSVLPGKDALVGQIIGSIASPMYGLIGTLETNLQELVYILSKGGESN